MKQTFVFVAGLVLVVAGCATQKEERAPAVEREPPPPATSTPTEVEAQVLEETKKTAAQQLECPLEEVSVTCTKRDAHGGCIAVQARGCGRTLEYDFGNE